MNLVGTFTMSSRLAVTATCKTFIPRGFIGELMSNSVFALLAMYYFNLLTLSIII